MHVQFSKGGETGQVGVYFPKVTNQGQDQELKIEVTEVALLALVPQTSNTEGTC